MRVDATVKLKLLGLIDQTTALGWSFGRACRVLGVRERRARDWIARRADGELEDRRPGRALHGLLGAEADLGLAPGAGPRG